MIRFIIASIPARAILGVAFLFLADPALACSKVVSSHYGPGFHGKRTASGERFNQNALTAAHRTLAFGTKIRVTYRGRSVVVRINDRGPFIRGRSLDISTAAAKRIGLDKPGVATVCMERL